MEPGSQESDGLLPDDEKDVTEADRGMINPPRKYRKLSIADTDDDGGFEEELSSSPNLGLKKLRQALIPLITPCPELRELRNAAYEDDKL